MDSLNPESPPVMEAPAARPPRVWKFCGTALWGLFIFAAMFVGQLWPVAVLRRVSSALTVTVNGWPPVTFDGAITDR